MSYSPHLILGCDTKGSILDAIVGQGLKIIVEKVEALRQRQKFIELMDVFGIDMRNSVLIINSIHNDRQVYVHL